MSERKRSASAQTIVSCSRAPKDIPWPVPDRLTTEVTPTALTARKAAIARVNWATSSGLASLVSGAGGTGATGTTGAGWGGVVASVVVEPVAPAGGAGAAGVSSAARAADATTPPPV